jgi:hypothetical protein
MCFPPAHCMTSGPVALLKDHQMKFIKVQNRRGFNHDHGTKFTVTDLARSNERFNFEAGTDRRPRCDSRFWNPARFMVWDVEANHQLRGEKK